MTQFKWVVDWSRSLLHVRRSGFDESSNLSSRPTSMPSPLPTISAHGLARDQSHLASVGPLSCMPRQGGMTHIILDASVNDRWPEDTRADSMVCNLSRSHSPGHFSSDSLPTYAFRPLTPDSALLYFPFQYTSILSLQESVSTSARRLQGQRLYPWIATPNPTPNQTLTQFTMVCVNQQRTAA